ncbi:FAD-dependent oxidoreductase [Fictibacillus phosphorivorans]|uniref:FAD-dependent oxidoreductase n=1 Tax=Fictibacillus phosphorivorans TaxID=1221500 RepID=UPI0011A2A414|nr:FAD-dependent oxidoreductase [Fictibacillus phosphorivorans]
MTKLLLIGGGHAHLSILRSLLNENVNNLEVTLITSSKFQYYSGMFSGFTEGLYDEDEIRIDLESLCSRASVSFIEDTIISFDPMQKVLLGFSGGIYSFDVISFDIGSGISSDLTRTVGLNIKPNYRFPEQIKKFRSSESPVIIGGGSAGVELALATSAWRQKQSLKNHVTLISSSPLLHSYGNKATKKIREIAKSHNLVYYENEKIDKLENNIVVTDKGTKIEYSAIMPVTGPKASSLFKQALLSTDIKGYLLVDDTLQSADYPYVFGAGDCVSLSIYPDLPKNGVYAVRQGPILWNNIKRLITGRTLVSFKPQKYYVSILSTGHKHGLFTYGDYVIYGKWAWSLKNLIDQKFMNKHL